MAAVARMSRRWAWRMRLVGSAFAAFAAWCVMDARVGYPRFNERAAEYNRLLAAGRAEAWPERAAEMDWSPRFRDEDRLADGRVVPKTAWDIGTQYVMMGGCLAVAAAVAIRILRARRRTMRADDSGFLTGEGVLVPYPEITDIDLKLWQRKSIAKVRFRHGNEVRTTVIDDWVYQGGEDVLAEVQRRTRLGVAGSEPSAAAASGDLPRDGARTPSGSAHAKPDSSA